MRRLHRLFFIEPAAFAGVRCHRAWAFVWSMYREDPLKWLLPTAFVVLGLLTVAEHVLLRLGLVARRPNPPTWFYLALLGGLVTAVAAVLVAAVALPPRLVMIRPGGVLHGWRWVNRRRIDSARMRSLSRSRRVVRVTEAGTGRSLVFGVPAHVRDEDLRVALEPFGSEVCGKCGYHLRGTPDRCPECGAVPQPPHNPPTMNPR